MELNKPIKMRLPWFWQNRLRNRLSLVQRFPKLWISMKIDWCNVWKSENWKRLLQNLNQTTFRTKVPTTMEISILFRNQDKRKNSWEISYWRWDRAQASKTLERNVLTEAYHLRETNRTFELAEPNAALSHLTWLYMSARRILKCGIFKRILDVY